MQILHFLQNPPITAATSPYSISRLSITNARTFWSRVCILNTKLHPNFHYKHENNKFISTNIWEDVIKIRIGSWEELCVYLIAIFKKNRLAVGWFCSPGRFWRDNAILTKNAFFQAAPPPQFEIFKIAQPNDVISKSSFPTLLSTNIRPVLIRWLKTFIKGEHLVHQISQISSTGKRPSSPGIAKSRPDTINIDSVSIKKYI